MHSRRLAALLLGVWLAGSLWILLVASHNLRAVDDVLGRSPAPAAKLVKSLGHAQARAFLRYQAAELNRWYYLSWEWAQLVVGPGLAASLYAGRRSGWPLRLALVMVALTAAERAWLTPRIAELGRGLDFAPDAWSPNRSLFGTYHRVYSAVEVLKLGLGLAITASLLYRATEVHRRRKPAERSARSERQMQ